MSLFLEVRQLRKAFGGATVVDDVSFTLAPQAITGLIGPNGAGKTTVFNLITGFLAPDSGEIRFLDQPVSSRAPHRIVGLGLARTFQELRLFGSISARENVMLAVQGQPGENVLALLGRWRHCNRHETTTRSYAEELLRFVGLEHVADTAASDLSYGQQKRVALARALASDARLICLDEPAAGLDPQAVQGMATLLRQLVDRGKTVLVVEHNLDLVRQICDHVMFMDQGCLVVQGPPAEVLADPRVYRGFMGI